MQIHCTIVTEVCRSITDHTYMETNFSFLQQEFEPMSANAHRAEEYVFTDPTYCAILCRKSLEQFVLWLYENDEVLNIPVDTNIEFFII